MSNKLNRQTASAIILATIIASASAVNVFAAGTADNASPQGQGPGKPTSPPSGNSPGNPPSNLITGSTKNIAGPAAYSLSSGTVIKSNLRITAVRTNESGIKVTRGSTLSLSDGTVTTTGNTSAQDSSSFYGLNAAVLAESGGKIQLANSTITTTGTGANGVFATGAGSSIALSHVKIRTKSDGGHGVDATLTAKLTLNDVDITTAGAHSAAIATDRGGGTVIATGGTLTTAGDGSPGLYSTGRIVVSGITSKSTGAEAAVVEGKNSISATNSILSSEKKWGVMIYQSMSGDAGVGRGAFSMQGGSLTAAVGPLFYVTNTNATIALKGARVTAASGTLLAASANRWGIAGANGGNVIFKAEGEHLNGNVTADSVSVITATLQDRTTLQGAINTSHTAGSVSLVLDKSSAWNVTGTSYLTGLTDGDKKLANIHGNGFTVYYDASARTNTWLHGKTYSLAAGGKLTPRTNGK